MRTTENDPTRLLPRSNDIQDLQVSMHADAVRTRSVRRDSGLVHTAFEEITLSASAPVARFPQLDMRGGAEYWYQLLSGKTGSRTKAARSSVGCAMMS
jgi:hypothetical protein